MSKACLAPKTDISCCHRRVPSDRSCNIGLGYDSLDSSIINFVREVVGLRMESYRVDFRGFVIESQG